MSHHTVSDSVNHVEYLIYPSFEISFHPSLFPVANNYFTEIEVRCIKPNMNNILEWQAVIQLPTMIKVEGEHSRSVRGAHDIFRQTRHW